MAESYSITLVTSYGIQIAIVDLFDTSTVYTNYIGTGNGLSRNISIPSGASFSVMWRVASGYSFSGAYFEYNGTRRTITDKDQDGFAIKKISNDMTISLCAVPTSKDSCLLYISPSMGVSLSVKDEKNVLYGSGMKVVVGSKIRISYSINYGYSKESASVYINDTVQYLSDTSAEFPVEGSSISIFVRAKRERQVGDLSIDIQSSDGVKIRVDGENGEYIAYGSGQWWVPRGTKISVRASVITGSNVNMKAGYLIRHLGDIIESYASEKVSIVVTGSVVVTAGEFGGPWPGLYSITSDISSNMKLAITYANNTYYDRKWFPEGSKISIEGYANYGYGLSKFTVTYNGTTSDYANGKFSVPSLSGDIVICASSEMTMAKLEKMLTKRTYKNAESDMLIHVVDESGKEYVSGDYIEVGTVLDIYCEPKTGSNVLGLCVNDSNGTRKIDNPNGHMTVSTIVGILTVSAVAAPSSYPYEEYLILIECAEGSSVDMRCIEDNSDPESGEVDFVEYHKKNLDWLQSYWQGFYVDVTELPGYTIVDYKITYGSNTLIYDDTDKLDTVYMYTDSAGDVVIRTKTVHGSYQAPVVMLTVKESEGCDIIIKDFNGQEYRDGYGIPKENILRVSHNVLPGYEFVSFTVSYNGETARYNYGDIVFVGHIRTPVTIELKTVRAGSVDIYTNGGYERHHVFIWTGKKWEQFVPYIYTEAGWTRCGR